MDSKIIDLEDCEYCGNVSDVVDDKGNCLSCGAKRKRKPENIFPGLRNSLERMRVICSSGSDIFSVDADTEFIYLNRGSGAPR